MESLAGPSKHLDALLESVASASASAETRHDNDESNSPLEKPPSFVSSQLGIPSEHLAFLRDRPSSSYDSDDDDDDEDGTLDNFSAERLSPPDLVLSYCSRPFKAIIQGQVSATKGDRIIVLNDSNPFWWLVRVTNTNDVGYIPWDHVESRQERISRLNARRNSNDTQAPVPVAQAQAQSKSSRPKSVGFTRSSVLYHYPAFEWSDRTEESDHEGDKPWDTWEERVENENQADRVDNENKPPVNDATGENSAHRPHSLGLSGSIGAVLRRTRSNISNLSVQSDLFLRVPRSRGRLEVSISELCSYIRSTPSAPDAKITILIRRKDIASVKHEFLLLLMRRPHGRDMWLRLERRAHTPSWLRFISMLSVAPANDSATMSGVEHRLYAEDESRIEARVTFETPPSLRDLEELLTVVCEESLQYKLWPENCYFFCSVVQEHLSRRYGGKLQSGRLAYEDLAPDVRFRIHTRMQRALPYPRHPDSDYPSSLTQDPFVLLANTPMLWRTTTTAEFYPLTQSHPSRDAKVVRLAWHKEFEHHFLILHVRNVSGQEMWLRLERIAKGGKIPSFLDGPELVMDSVIMAGSEASLFKGRSKTKTIVPLPLGPIMKDLGSILTSLDVVSKEQRVQFNRVSDHSRFFCSIVHEYFFTHYEGLPKLRRSRSYGWYLAPQVRGEIFTAMQRL